MITIAIPYKGRSLEQVLDKFVGLGAISKKERNFYVQTTQDDKERISAEREDIKLGKRAFHSSNIAIGRKLQSIQEKNPLGFGLTVDYDEHRVGQPARILFKTVDAQVEGIPVRLVGRSHYDIPTVLRNHAAQIGFVGWDELYADHIEHLKKGDIREWSAMNASLREGSTDVRILGSANLSDYAGHFILLHQSIGKQIKEVLTSEDSAAPYLFRDYFGPAMDIGDGEFGPVFVDHKYQGIYQTLLPRWTAGFVGSSNVEKDVKKHKGVGIYVVQSGKTVAKDNLHFVGPLFYSETVIAVNNEDLVHNPKVMKVAKAVEPREQGSIESRVDYTQWQLTLLNNAGDNYHHCSDLGIGYIPGRTNRDNLELAS